MGGLELNHWTRCTVNMVHKTELTTKSVIFSPRVEIEDTSEVVWPLLLDISRIGSASDPSRILQTGGEVRITDAIGSFGVERKFSDLLERYSLIDQEVSIEYQTTAAGDYNPSSFTEVFVGKIQDWTIDIDRQIPAISIRFKPKLFNNRYITKKIDPVLFPNAPTRNYFKTLPVVIGDDIQIKPIQVVADGDSSPEYAYATTFGTTFVNGGVGTFYVRHSDNVYRQFVSAGTTATLLYGNAYATGKNNGAYGTNSITGKKFTASTAYIATNVAVGIYKSAGTSNQSLTIEIRAADRAQTSTPTAAPGTILGSATYALNTLSSSAGSYNIETTLDKAVLLQQGKDYYFIWYVSEPFGGVCQRYYDSAVNEDGYLTVYTTTTDGLWEVDTSGGPTGKKFYWQVYGVVVTDTETPGPSLIDQEGKGYSYFELSQNTAIPGASAPDLTKLDYLVAISGLVDDGSGTITGTPSSLINTTKEAIKLIEREWNGSTWAATGNWDFAAYSDTHSVAESTTSPYYRKPQGATTGDTTFETWLSDICENTAARPVLQRNGTIGLYYWGAEQATSKVFTQENSKVTRITELESRYVMNRLIMAYQRKIESVLGFELRFRVEQTPQDYASVLNWYSTLNTFLTDLIGDSITLYGERPSAKLLFDWISDQTSAELLARYLLTTYNSPPRYVELEVPVSTFLVGELMDVVELKHPTLPTFLGSSPNAKAAQYDGELADITNGYVLTRAQRYRGQIESMTIDFNEDIVPTFGIATRLLLNTQDPT